jgi:predicted DNA-binding transcriptional regulator YafY
MNRIERLRSVVAPAPPAYRRRDRPSLRGIAADGGTRHVGAAQDRCAHFRTGRRERRLFAAPPAELDYYTRLFAMLGCEAEVYEPQELRQRLRQLGKQIAEHYQER